MVENENWLRGVQFELRLTELALQIISCLLCSTMFLVTIAAPATGLYRSTIRRKITHWTIWLSHGCLQPLPKVIYHHEVRADVGNVRVQKPMAIRGNRDA